MDRFVVRQLGRDSAPPTKKYRGLLPEGRWTGSSEVWLVGAHGRNVDFSRLTLQNFTADGSVLEWCDFSRTSFEAGTFAVGRQSTFRECDFRGADLRHIDLGQARFEECHFENARIHDWASDAAEFVDCHFVGRLTDCRFSGRPWGMWDETGRVDPPRATNEFRGNDFLQAELIGCSFVRGIDIAAQRWPESDDYVFLDHLPRRIELAMPRILKWPDARQRDEGLILLKVFSEIGYESQPDLFANRWDLGLDREAVDKAWEVLAQVEP